jgi:hypothetical protein
MNSLDPKCGTPLGGESETAAGCPGGPDEHIVANPEEKSTETPPDDSPEAWRVECERAAFHAGVLLRLANIPGGISAAIVELIQTAPRSESDLETLPETTLFARITRAAYRLGGDTDSFRAASEYITEHLMKMPPQRRRMLEASLSGAFMGWLMS